MFQEMFGKKPAAKRPKKGITVTIRGRVPTVAAAEAVARRTVEFAKSQGGKSK